MATGNVTYEQTVGLMTAMTEITRNGAKSARGLVSIQSRYNQIIDESSSTGKKLTQWYKDHNIAIKDQNGQLRSFFEVGKDVAKIWDTLSDNEKKYYLNTQAGANQSQNLAALMRNYQTAIDATATALDSAGSAAEENARYMQSMQGALKDLNRAWENFSRKMISSGTLTDLIEGLTKFVNFLSTDFGQTMVKAAAGAIAFGGAFKLLSGLASLVISPFKSATKVFGLFGKTAGKTVKPLERVGKGMKVVKAPTVGAAKAAGKAATGFTLLGGSFSGLASILTSPAGLIAGMLALGAGIMYVNTQINKAKSPEKQYKKTHKKLGELESKYDEVTDAIDKLHKKQEGGGLTPAESSQLAYLEQEKSQVEELIETYRELEKAQKTQSARTPDPEVNKTDKVKQHMRPVTKASPLGAVTKQAQKDAGAYDLLSSKVQIYGDKVVQAGKKQHEMNNLLSKAKDAQASEEYDKAQKYLDKYDEKAGEAKTAQEDINKAFEDMKKTNDELKEFYGSQDKMPKDISESSKAVDKLVGAYRDLNQLNDKGGEKGVDFTGLSGAALDKTIDDFKTLGDTIGITVDESGKLNSVNFDTFTASLDSMGYTTEEIDSALRMLGEQHPEATFEIAGVEVAGKDIDTLLGYLDEADGDSAEATIEVAGAEYSVSELRLVDGHLETLDGTVVNPSVKVNSASADEALTQTKQKAKEVGEQKPKIKVTADTAGAERKLNKLEGGSGKTTKKDVKVGANTSSATSALSIFKKSLTGVKDKTVKVTAKPVGISNVKSQINSLPKTKYIDVYVRKHGSVDTNASGTKHAIEGLSEVNERGWEFIRDAKTGKLRVAAGGERTVTYLNEGDIVYTHGESMRMVRQGETGDVVIPQHASGKNEKKKKKKQEAYDKEYSKLNKAHERAMKELEYKANTQHWNDKKLAELELNQIKATNAKIKALNKKKKYKGWGLSKQNPIDTLDAEYKLKNAEFEVDHEAQTSAIEKAISGAVGTTADLQAIKKKINSSDKLSAEEKSKYLQEAYKNNVEYLQKMFKESRAVYDEFGRKHELTYDEMRKTLDNYYKEGMLTAKEYYENLDDLADEQLAKEKERLEKQQELNNNTYSLAKAYVQRQIDVLEKQNEEQETQNELIEKQNDLEKARNKRIRVYREGQGFVYEQDTEAIREATQALEDFKKTEESPELKQWRSVMELFDELESLAEIKDLENKVGATAQGLFGGFGTDIGAWTKFVKENLATSMGYDNLLEAMGNLVGYEAIFDWLQGSGETVSTRQIADAIAKNRFASGTLSAPAGFARVAENGYEIALLGKGDAVMPHNVSKNLMEWGKMSPLEYANGTTGDSYMYQFDKLVLPNVQNVNDFMRELKNLPNKALQFSGGRM